MSFPGGVAVPARFRSRVEPRRSWMGSAFALGLSILVFLPVFPSMPAIGNDASWRMALNEAWARDMDFGRLVFTYGPYAFLSTAQYHPDTYGVLVGCSVFLGTVLFLLLRHLEGGSKQTVRIAFILPCLIASDYTSSPDVRFFCFGFFLLAAAAKRPQTDADEIRRPSLPSASVVLNLAAFSLGLIALVKATYAVEAGVMGALSMLVLYRAERRLLAPALLASFALGLILFWLGAGQSLAALPRFFLNQAYVAAGYGQAMSVGEDLLPPALFLACTIPLAIAVKRDLQQPAAGRYAIAIGMAFTLFLSFKEGFVREDDWHVMTAAEVLLILPWCWPFARLDRWRVTQTALTAAAAIVLILRFPHALDLQGKAERLEQFVHCSDRGPIVCPTRIGWLQRTYDLSLARIRAQVPLPKVQGTVDVYTVSQYLAAAYGYRWDPRPVIQSYSAYSPVLARLNADHLTGARPPDGILFALNAIDSRLPALADGPSWPILLSRYSVEWLGNLPQPTEGQSVAYLVRKPDSARITVIRSPLLQTTAALGHRVRLPRSGDALFAKIDIRPDVYGRFEQVLFKDPELYVNFRFPNGAMERYRFIPGMARAGFVISPVVVDTEQFASLRDLEPRKGLSERRPTEFWLSGARGAGLIWTNAAAVEISSLREKSN